MFWDEEIGLREGKGLAQDLTTIVDCLKARIRTGSSGSGFIIFPGICSLIDQRRRSPFLIIWRECGKPDLPHLPGPIGIQHCLWLASLSLYAMWTERALVLYTEAKSYPNIFQPLHLYIFQPLQIYIFQPLHFYVQFNNYSWNKSVDLWSFRD